MSREYIVTFDRIGRTHDIVFHARAEDADALAEQVHAFARRFLRSQDYDVHVDLDQGNGFILCGFNNGGTFTIAEPGADQAELMALDGAA